MNNQGLTLLSEGQIWGNDKESQLEVIRKYGTRAAITDLCVLTGSYLCEYNNTKEDSSLRGRTSQFWTRTFYEQNDVRNVTRIGMALGNWGNERSNAVRPVLQSPVIFSQIYQNRVRGYNGT